MPSVADFYRPHLPFPIISDRDGIQEHYEQCRLQGTSHRLAEVFAFQAAPAVNTDTRWIGGHDFRVNEETLGGQRLIEEAKAAGVSTRGRVYKAGLAQYPGDPQAWVESKADCYRRAEELGVDLEGDTMNYKCTERFEPPTKSGGGKERYEVAPDIVEDRWQDAIAEDPGLLHQKDAKEALAESLAGDQ